MQCGNIKNKSNNYVCTINSIHILTYTTKLVNKVMQLHLCNNSEVHNTKASSFCIRVQGPTIWNSIPQDIKDCKLLNPFKYKLNSYL